MILQNYPPHVNLRNRFSQLCGQHVGILESQLLFSAKAPNFPSPVLCTNSMPAYHKILIREDVEVSYHLSGYGIYKEEALIRLLGEGIERYALQIAPTLYKKKLKFLSYNDIKKEGHVMPWEYIRIFSDEDYEKLANKTILKNITENDTIGWAKCASLFEAGKEIFIPAQLLFTGYQINKEVGETFFTPGFSKGSSAHTDFKKALTSGIIEAIEADSLMIRWFTKTKAKKVLIDDTTLLNILSSLLGKFDYEIIPYYFTLPELPIHAFGVVLMNRKNERPFCVVGCQAGLDPVQTLYRAIMEAMAILYLANYGPLVMPKDYLETTKQKDYTNLDSNVAYFADAIDIDEKKELFNSLMDGEIALSGLKDLSSKDDNVELGYVLNQVHKLSEYGVFIDITPPESADKGWKVLRTFFPELVQMSLPGFPYSNHPRIKEYGGIKNVYPHPVP